MKKEIKPPFRLCSVKELQVKHIIKLLKNLDGVGIDGETMQYIIEELGMNDQMLRQLILSNPQSDTKALYDEHIRLSDQELNRLKIDKITTKTKNQ
tara:strand:- start:112 stop:399 length:288 start_codon:yes stop_codon:yes gene_type:complete